MLIVASTLFGLVLVEGALRIMGVTPETETLWVYEFQNQLGWWPRRSFRYYRSTPFYGHFNYYDNDRMVSGPDDFRRPADRATPAVAILGDSFVEGYYVPWDKSFAHLLGQTITDRQLLNLGVSGYSPEQYLLRARMSLPDFDVRQVIVVLFAQNDVVHTDVSPYQGYAKPVFGPDIGEPINVPLPQVLGESGGGNPIRLFARRFAVYAFLRPVYRRWVLPEAVEVATPDQMMLPEAKFRRAMAIIREIGRVKPGADLIVTYLPAYTEAMASEVLRRNTDLFRTICVEDGLRCHVPDVGRLGREELRALYVDPLRGEGHLSEKGSAWYARFLEGVLSRSENGVGDFPEGAVPPSGEGD